MADQQANRLIVERAIREMMPETAVQKALAGEVFAGDIKLIAVGKSAWRMAGAAQELLGERIREGLVILPKRYNLSALPDLEIMEAGSPVPDEQSLLAADRVLAMLEGLTEHDTVLLLASAGGASLMEQPLPGVSLAEMRNLLTQAKAAGVRAMEINTLYKHLSALKGGRLAAYCAPARVVSVVLSDVLGSPLDVLACGMACPDTSTSEEALAVIERYGLATTPAILAALATETPKALDNVQTLMTGSVRMLCKPETAADARDYQSLLLTTTLQCDALSASGLLATLARQMAQGGEAQRRQTAVIADGGTVIRFKGADDSTRDLPLTAAVNLHAPGDRDHAITLDVRTVLPPRSMPSRLQAVGDLVIAEETEADRGLLMVVCK